MCNSCRMATPDLVTTAEAADMLGRSVAYVTRLATNPADRPQLPTYAKAPGKRGARMFRRVDVERLAARTQTTRGAA